MTNLLDSAIWYAQQKHWPVFPLSGKIPFKGTSGCLDATDDIERITSWWIEKPHANVGIRTGKISNFFVLDIDVHHDGDESLHELEKTHCPLPDTVMVLTGRGGSHYYFNYPAHREIRNRANVRPGIDVRGDGGYVVAPPSIHPDTKRPYEWDVSHRPEEIPIADAPEWLLDLICQKSKTICQTGDSKIQEGSRNESLFRLARSMSRTGLQQSAIHAVLLVTNNTQCSPPLAASEIEKIVESACSDRYDQGDINEGSENWEAPILFDGIDTPEIPTKLLPGWLGEFAEAVSKNTQTPTGLSVMMGLAVAATCVQKKYEIKPHNDGYREPLCIWTLTALPPATRKTAVLSAFIESVLDWEKQQEISHHSEFESIETIRNINLKRIEKRQQDAAKCDKELDRESIIQEIERLKKETPEEKYPPRLWTGDVTPERLQSLMAEHGEKMSFLSDEGGIFEIMAGLYSDGAANLDVFLKGHSGSAVRVDRGKRTVHMDNPALTFGLAIQPQIIQEFGIGKKRKFRGNGALARFLYCLPRSNVGKRDVTRRYLIPDSVKLAYHRGIQNLLDIEFEETRILTLDKESMSAWQAFCQYVETNQGEGRDFEDIQDWTGKLPGAALRIASLFHLVETEGSTLILSKKSMEPALDLCALLIDHCKAAFCSMGNDQAVQDAIQIYNWLIRENKFRVKRRDIHRALHGRFTKADRLDSALNELVHRNILSPPDREKTGRRPSIWHSVNPQILGENNHGMA